MFYFFYLGISLVALTRSQSLSCQSSLAAINSESILSSGRGLNDLGDIEGCGKNPDTRYVLLAAQIQGFTAFRVNLGFCGSKECSIQDYHGYADFVKPFLLRSFNITNDAAVDFSFSFPQDLYTREYNSGFIVMVTITCVIVLICLIGTLLEYFYSKQQINNEKILKKTAIDEPLLGEGEKIKQRSAIARFFLCFSYITNINKLMSSQSNPANARLEVLNGLRFFSMMWVIYGHTYYYLLISPITNPLKLLEYIDNFWYQILFQAPFSVDSFFFLAGFLGAFAMIPEIKARKAKINFFQLFFHRYYRIMPLYAFLIFMAWKFEPFINQGPIWPDFQASFDSGCEKYWWTNIVFLNNFIPWDAPCGCFGWGWYLANDYQFFIITPFLLILYYKNKKLGWVLSLMLLIVSFFVTFALAYDSEFAVDYVTLAPNYLDYWYKIYSKPYCRIQPYLIGVILAYLYLEGRDEPEKDHEKDSAQKLKNQMKSWKIRYIFYVFGLSLILLPVFLPYDANHYPGTWPRGWNAIYIGFSRGIFALGLSLLIYPVLMGYGRGIYGFLGAKIFIPLARLTFAAYLVHPMIVQMLYYGSKQGIYIDSWRIFFNYASFLLITYCLAFLLSVSLESPILGIEKEFIFKKKKQEVKKGEEPVVGVNGEKENEKLVVNEQNKA